MHIPKPAIAHINIIPACFPIGLCVRTIEVINAPIDGAPLSKPSDSGPIWKILSTKIGNIATAPPNKTANKSRAIAPQIICREKTKRRPSIIFSCTPTSFDFFSITVFVFIIKKQMNVTNMRAAAAKYVLGADSQT